MNGVKCCGKKKGFAYKGSQSQKEGIVERFFPNRRTHGEEIDAKGWPSGFASFLNVLDLSQDFTEGRNKFEIILFIFQFRVPSKIIILKKTLQSTFQHRSSHIFLESLFKLGHVVFDEIG